MGYRDRSQANIKAADWVLVSMRMYESENQYNDRKGEILLRYSDGQVRQLTKAGELRERASDQQSSVVFDDAGVICINLLYPLLDNNKVDLVAYGTLFNYH